jgi:hypothetical protein
MTTYTLRWGSNYNEPSGRYTAEVTTPSNLHPVLDQIAVNGATPGASYTGMPTEDNGEAAQRLQLVWPSHRAGMIWPGSDPAVALAPWRMENTRMHIVAAYCQDSGLQALAAELGQHRQPGPLAVRLAGTNAQLDSLPPRELIAVDERWLVS